MSLPEAAAAAAGRYYNGPEWYTPRPHDACTIMLYVIILLKYGHIMHWMYFIRAYVLDTQKLAFCFSAVGPIKRRPA